MFVNFADLRRNHLDGCGGIRELSKIALPMVISSAFDVFIMFVDRLFLAKIDSLQMAAMMTGGLTCFTASTFFIGLIGYSGATTAHFYGAGRKKDCALMTTQAFILALISYPLVLLLIPVGVMSFSWAGHAPEQIKYESDYFMITMVFGSMISLLRTPFASFFSGIGKTKIIMIANAGGLLANLFLAYVFIIGAFGVPPMGIYGAAIAVCASSLVNLALMIFFYFRKENRIAFSLAESYRINPHLMRILIRFGMPSGLELFINLSAFTTMVSMFHSYGATIASAVTVVFNWDMIAFVPMVGLQVAVTTLVGQNLGRKNEEGAIKAAYSGFKLNCIYAGFMLSLFLAIPGVLVEIFKPSHAGPEWEEISKTAIPMIMLMSIYPLADGMLIVFSGAIRGAGDTTWAMIASSVLHWSAALYSFVLTQVLVLPPVFAWGLFVLVFPFFGLTFWLRFRSGKWKGKLSLPPDETPGALDLEPSPALQNE